MEFSNIFDRFYKENPNFFLEHLPNTPIYRNLPLSSHTLSDGGFEHFCTLPQTTKADIAKDFPFNFGVKNYSSGLDSGDLEIVESSGTSANRIQIVRPSSSRKEWSDRVNAFYRGDSFQCGIKEALLTTMNCSRTQCNLPVSSYEERRYLSYLVLNRNKNPTLWTDSECYRILDELKRFSPRILTAHPVYLAYLDSWCARKGIEPLTFDEVSLSYDFPSEMHKKIARKWSKGTISISYGLTEVFTAAIECEKGKNHVVHDGLFLEILKGREHAKLNEIGELVATSSRNPVMPFLRYQTGDLCSISSFDHDCDCSRSGMIIGRIEGRISELTITEDNRLVTTATLDDVVSGIPNILVYQLRQDEDRSVTLQIVPGAAFNDRERMQLQEGLKALYRSSKVTIVDVPEIRSTHTGKYPLIQKSSLDNPRDLISQLTFASV